MAKLGRPSTYSPALTAKICAAIAEGKSLLSVCKMPGMPNAATVCRWLEKHAIFREEYARARETQCEVLAAEIIEIADASREGRKTEVKEIGRECSKCLNAVRWRGKGWIHADGSDICEQAAAAKIVETKTVTGDMVERSRLQVDARKWYLSKVLPKKYGDRLALSGDGDGGPISLTLDILDKLRGNGE